MTQATIGFVTLAILDTSVSPNSYKTVEEILSVSEVGAEGTQIEVTNFDSGASKEFIAGLLEGINIDVEANLRLPASAGPNQAILTAACVALQNRIFRLTFTNCSPQKKVNFTASCLGYGYRPGTTEQHKIGWKLKVTGAIT